MLPPFSSLSLRCVALCCAALRPPPVGGSNHPRDSYITVLISESWGQGGVEVHPMILINVSFL